MADTGATQSVSYTHLAGTFGDLFGAFHQHGDGAFHLMLGDDYHFDVLVAENFQRVLADVAHGDALGDRGAADFNFLAGKGLGEGGIVFDLDAEHFEFRAQRAGDHGAAGEQAAAAGGGDQHVKVRHVLQHFQRHGTLAGDDGGVVIGVEEEQTVFVGEFMRVGSGFGQGFAVEHHFRAPGGSAGNLGGRRVHRHDDGGFDACELGVARDGLGVVARRHGDDAGFTFGLGEQGDTVGGTALLEGAGGLEVVVFEVDFRAGEAGEAVRAQEGGAQYGALDPLGGVLHVLEGDHVCISRR